MGMKQGVGLYMKPSSSTSSRGGSALPPVPPPSEEQQTVCDHMVAGDNVVVDACAGSGKSTTILSVARCLPKQRFLQVTYNAALRKEFQAKVQEYGLKNVDVHTYHSLAVRYFSPDAYTDTGIRRLLGSLPGQGETEVANPTLVGKYNIVVLDEAQDMTLLYFRLIQHLLRCVCASTTRRTRGGGGVRHRVQLLVLGDWMQGLYEFKGADIRFLTLAPEIWAPFADRFLRTATFRRCTLRTSYRITRPMASFVNHVMIGSGGSGAGGTGSRLLACRDGAQVVYLRHGRPQLERIVVHHILRILEDGDLPSDIFILGASVKGTNSNVRKMENALVERGIPCHVPMLENDSMDERVIRGKVVFSTFHSVKGRQRKYVFIMGFDQGYFTHYARNLPEDRCPNTLYVGCTRATHRMFLLENNDRATDQPLRFLKYSHRELAQLDYVDFRGQPQTIFYEAAAAPAGAQGDGAPVKTHYVTPTEIIKFVPERVLDVVTPLLEQLFVLIQPAILEEQDSEPSDSAKPDPVVRGCREAADPIPSVVYFTKSGLYEDVADLNGIALPCLFWDRMTTGTAEAASRQNVLYTLISEMLSDLKEHEHGTLRRAFAAVDPHSRAAADYLYLANLYVAVQEKLYFKLTQIPREEYGWLTEEAVATCVTRMQEVIGPRKRMVAHEHVLVHPKMETVHVAMDAALRPWFGDQVRYRFAARLDLVTQDAVWEIKCTHALTIEHRLQMVIYAWLWRLFPEPLAPHLGEAASVMPFRLFNIKTGEVYELQATTDELTHIVVELLRGKYAAPVVLSDAEFLASTEEPDVGQVV